MKRRTAFMCLALAAGCASDAVDASYFELAVRYPSGLEIDHLVVSAALPVSPPREVRADLPSPPRPLDDLGETLVLALPEGMPGAFEVNIEGYSGDLLRARGVARVELPAASTLVTLIATEACAEPPCEPVQVCGDGIVEGPEDCDDGDASDGDGCDDECEIESGWICEGAPSMCAPDCPDGCPTCGDGTVQSSETCDDTDRLSGDGCNVACGVEPGWTCAGAPSVCGPICGDAVVLDAESCDDGGLANGDGCGSTCEVEAGYACVGEPSECGPVCGDGLVREAETCDDGALEDGDGCNGSCGLEEGWSCRGAPSSCEPTCGDGLLRGEERCDDGGRRPGDGCDNTCEVEVGYRCEGEPSVCTTSVEPDAGPADAGELDSGVEPDDAGVGADATPSDASSDAGGDAGVWPDAQPVDGGFVVTAPTRWGFANLPVAFSAGDCVPVELQRTDDLGALSQEPTARSAQLALTSGQGVGLHSDPACATQLFSARLEAGVAERTLYVKGLTAGGFEFSASSPGLVDGLLTSSIVGASPVSIDVVGGPTSMIWGECASPPVAIELRDAFGNLAQNDADRRLHVTTSTPGAVVFGVGSTCTSTSSWLTVPAGAASASAHLLGRRVGTFSVEVSGNGLADANGTLRVDTATASCASCATGGACADTCSSTNVCNSPCPAGCACDVGCIAGARKCKPNCGVGADCRMDCIGQSECAAVCRINSDCVIECAGAVACDKVECEPGARCMLACDGAVRCGFDVCYSGQMSCPGNILVCNRACP